ncbi:MAG TPA: thermonuclease family protein, partial [Thermoanaerobaculia bacterium]|nr:thermonuclease family protein [Thermoanaerobaculia bacterium]
MRSRLAAAIVLLLACAPASRADWIVYLGGGVTEIEGTWEVRGRQVLFHSRSGTLLSVRAEDVDLPASAFLSWQVGDRRKAPGSAAEARRVAEPPVAAPLPGKSECIAARVHRIDAAETLELEIAGKVETVHLTCVDTPETRHRFPELAGYGGLAASAVESRAPAGASVCLIEETPPRRDRQGHRVAYVRLADGGDLGAEMIGGGYGLARRDECGRGAS